MIRRRLILLLVLTGLLSVAWSLSVPLTSRDYWGQWGNWFPDEADHLCVARYWSQFGKPPPYAPPYMTSQHPPLYHVMAACLLRAFSDNLLVVRLLSATMGLVTVWFSWLAARRIAGREVGLLSAAIVALVPMRLALSGAASNENLATCSAAGALAALAALARRRRGSNFNGFLLAVAIIAGVGAKLTCVGLLAAAFPVLAFRCGRRRAALLTLGVGLISLGTWNWWFQWNQAHYGDWLLQGVMHSYWDSRQPGYFRLSEARGISLARYLFAIAATGGRSFWGMFQGMTRPLPLPVYGFLLLWFVESISLSRFRSRARGIRYWWIGAGLYSTFLGGVFVWYNLDFFSAQGRYLHGTLVPLSIVLARGWLRPFPARFRRRAGEALALSLVLLNLYCLAAYPPWR